MATRYRFGDNEKPHFITFAVVNWIECIFKRNLYTNFARKLTVLYCQQRFIASRLGGHEQSCPFNSIGKGRYYDGGCHARYEEIHQSTDYRSN